MSLAMRRGRGGGGGDGDGEGDGEVISSSRTQTLRFMRRGFACTLTLWILARGHAVCDLLYLGDVQVFHKIIFEDGVRDQLASPG